MRASMLHQPTLTVCLLYQQLPAPSILIKFQLTPLHSKNWANYAFIRVLPCPHHAIDTLHENDSK